MLWACVWDWDACAPSCFLVVFASFLPVGVVKIFIDVPYKAPVGIAYWNTQYTYYFMHLHIRWLNIEPRQIIHLAVSTDEEQEIAVKRMLHYVGQMPSQEVYQPPPVPFVSLSTNVVSNIKYHYPTIKSLFNLKFTSATHCLFLLWKKIMEMWHKFPSWKLLKLHSLHTVALQTC